MRAENRPSCVAQHLGLLRHGQQGEVVKAAGPRIAIMPSRQVSAAETGAPQNAWGQVSNGPLKHRPKNLTTSVCSRPAIAAASRPWPVGATRPTSPGCTVGAGRSKMAHWLATIFGWPVQCIERPRAPVCVVLAKRAADAGLPGQDVARRWHFGIGQHGGG